MMVSIAPQFRLGGGGRTAGRGLHPLTGQSVQTGYETNDGEYCPTVLVGGRGRTAGRAPPTDRPISTDRVRD